MAVGGMSLEQQFQTYSKFGDTRSDGKSITLTNVDKWLKQALIIDGKTITTTDTGIAFNKFKSRTINFEQFLKFLEDLATQKNLDFQSLQDKMAGCGLPGTTVQAAAVAACDRLADKLTDRFR